jgi:primosomal protein N' (replication factor Y)
VLGFGTERVEDEVALTVPGARCSRLDADTATAGGIDRILQAFRRGESNVLVGTQIVAKGHDFPSVTLVGVLLAEQSLAFPDFRAAERTFQLLTQVAGRAGRGDAPGQVFIQTYDPSQYALRYAASHDFLGFAVVENRMRRERGYPPHAYLASIEVSSPDAVEAARLADEVRDYVGQFLTVEGARPGEVAILGPATAPIERLRGRTRMQVLLKGRRRSVMNGALWRLYRLVGTGWGKARIRIDVDPVNLL